MRKSGLCDKKRGCAYFDTPSLRLASPLKKYSHRDTEYQRQTPYYIQSSQRRLHRKEFTKRAHRRSFYILFKAKPSLCSESRVSLRGSVSLCEPYKSKLICNIKVSDKTPSPRTSLPERTAAKNRGENGGFYGKRREETEKTVV